MILDEIVQYKKKELKRSKYAQMSTMTTMASWPK